MDRRKDSREFKVEAARMISERGVSVAQTLRDLYIHQTVPHEWVKAFSGSPLRNVTWPREWHVRRDGAKETRLSITIGSPTLWRTLRTH